MTTTSGWRSLRPPVTSHRPSPHRRDHREEELESRDINILETKRPAYTSPSPRDSYVRQLSVNDVPVEFTVDTGSEVTLITKETSDLLGLALNKTSQVLVAANGGSLAVLGRAFVEVSNNERTTWAPVFVCGDIARNLLGKPQIEALRLLSFVNVVSVTRDSSHHAVSAGRKPPASLDDPHGPAPPLCLELPVRKPAASAALAGKPASKALAPLSLYGFLSSRRL